MVVAWGEVLVRLVRISRGSRTGPACSSAGRKALVTAFDPFAGSAIGTRLPTCSPPDCTDAHGNARCRRSPLPGGKIHTRLALAVAILTSSQPSPPLAVIGSRCVGAARGCIASRVSPDTNNRQHAANNSDRDPAGLAFTPLTDRKRHLPNPPNRRRSRAHPGIQLTRGSPTTDGERGPPAPARRLEGSWSSPGLRHPHEFNGDFAWSDYVRQKGYAYARRTRASSSDAGGDQRHAPRRSARAGSIQLAVWAISSTRPRPPFTIGPRACAGPPRPRRSARPHFGPFARKTFSVGLPTAATRFAGRREAPELFDGGWTGKGPSPTREAPITDDLPPAILNFPDTARLGIQPEQHRREEHPRGRISAGHRLGTVSLWGLYSAQFGK